MKSWVECNFDWNIEASLAQFLEAHKDEQTAFRGKGSMKTLRHAFEVHKKVRVRMAEWFDTQSTDYAVSGTASRKILSPLGRSLCRILPGLCAVRFYVAHLQHNGYPFGRTCG